MKRSVYIPDDLDVAVSRIAGERNWSEVVQEGLSLYLKSREPVTVASAESTARFEGRIHAIQQRMATDLQDEAERGYATGVELAEQISWYGLQQIAEHNFDLEEWLGSCGYPALDTSDDAKALKLLNWEWRPDEEAQWDDQWCIAKITDPKKGRHFYTALETALRDVWSVVIGMPVNRELAEAPPDEVPF